MLFCGKKKKDFHLEIILSVLKSLKNKNSRTSLVVQRLRTACQCRGHRFYPWSRNEDPTCRRAAQPLHHKYRSPRALKSGLCNRRNHRGGKPYTRARAAPTHCTGESLPSARKTHCTGESLPSASKTQCTGESLPSARKTHCTGESLFSARKTHCAGESLPSASKTHCTGDSLLSASKTHCTEQSLPSATKAQCTGESLPSARRAQCSHKKSKGSTYESFPLPVSPGTHILRHLLCSSCTLCVCRRCVQVYIRVVV